MDRPVCDICHSHLLLGCNSVWSELEQKSYTQYWCTQCNWVGIPQFTEGELKNIKRTETIDKMLNEK